MLQRKPKGLRRSIKVPHHSDCHPSRTTTIAEGPPALVQSPLTLQLDCPAHPSLPFLELSPSSGTVLLCPSHHVILFSPSASEALPSHRLSRSPLPTSVPSRSHHHPLWLPNLSLVPSAVSPSARSPLRPSALAQHGALAPPPFPSPFAARPRPWVT